MSFRNTVMMFYPAHMSIKFNLTHRRVFMISNYEIVYHDIIGKERNKEAKNDYFGELINLCPKKYTSSVYGKWLEFGVKHSAFMYRDKDDLKIKVDVQKLLKLDTYEPIDYQSFMIIFDGIHKIINEHFEVDEDWAKVPIGVHNFVHVAYLRLPGTASQNLNMFLETDDFEFKHDSVISMLYDCRIPITIESCENLLDKKEKPYISTNECILKMQVEADECWEYFETFGEFNYFNSICKNRLSELIEQGMRSNEFEVSRHFARVKQSMVFKG